MSTIKSFAYKLLGERYTRLAFLRRDIQTRVYSLVHPYRYCPKRYGNCFINSKPSYSYNDKVLEKVDRVIYVFWTGDNDITPNCLQGIESLEEASGVKVQIITPQNLSEYIVDEDPLPEAYQYLSFVHRSDFLRGYFMYHHGGGYADIKTFYQSWLPAFDKLDASDAYVLGYPEVGWKGAKHDGMENMALAHDLGVYWSLLIGNGAFICRPHTRFVAEWYATSRRRLISYTELLRQHPAKDAFGTNEDYPLTWECLQGAIFHPMCLKYHDRLLKDKALMPSFKNYR